MLRKNVKVVDFSFFLLYNKNHFLGGDSFDKN